MITSLYLYGVLAFRASVYAHIHVREEAVRIVSIPIPTQAEPFTTTVAGCSTVAPIVIEGVPTGTFHAGTLTFFAPPQAYPTRTTIIDTKLNATEVVAIEPLQGSCADFPFAPPFVPTSTDSTVSPISTEPVCPDPENVCGFPIKAAVNVIEVINGGILLSQALQYTARRLGEGQVQGNAAAAQLPFKNILKGLQQLKIVLEQSLPRVTFGPVFPGGCDTDAVTVAFIQFVKTTRDLLEILIGRVGYLESSAIAFEIAGALKDISFAVDTFAVSLLPKIPSREECSKQQRQDIDRTLAETIKVYQQTDFGDPWKESV